MTQWSNSTVSSVDLERGPARELRLAGDHLDLALLRQPGEAAGQLADHLVLPPAQRVDDRSPARRTRSRTPPPPRPRRSPARRAAAPSTGCSRRSGRRRQALVALDKGDLEAEVGGPERRRVAAGPGADHGHPLALGGGIGGRRLAPSELAPSRRTGASEGSAAARRRTLRRRTSSVLRLRFSALASDAVRRRIGVPSETLSLIETRISSTVPAAGSGDVHRRLVGLERDERVLGLETSSPAETWISITGTSSKSPMSGTLDRPLRAGPAGSRRARSRGRR